VRAEFNETSVCLSNLLVVVVVIVLFSWVCLPSVFSRKFYPRTDKTFPVEERIDFVFPMLLASFFWWRIELWADATTSFLVSPILVRTLSIISLFGSWEKTRESAKEKIWFLMFYNLYVFFFFFFLPFNNSG
jgi:hypothetical protein